MRKFITISPLQEKLSCVKYKAVDNNLLQYNDETCFSVIPLLNGYVKEEDEIELIVLCHNGHKDKHGNFKNSSEENFKTLKKEVENLQKKKNFRYTIRKI